MSRFVEVPSEALFTRLRAAGFTERPNDPHRPSAEVVFERKHDRDPRYRILVYTSARRGSFVARAKGADAIRVCAIFVDGFVSRGVAKLPRVHRTGSVDAVLERVIERARDAYAICNQRIGRRS